METTVNERVKLLRKYLNLSQQQLASTINSTTMTISRIEKGITEPRQSTVNLIIDSYNVNREWLLHGTGEMFLPGQSPESIPVSESVWKDEAYQALKEEVKYLREMLKLAMTGTKSFPNDIIGAGLINSFEKFGNIVRA